MIELLVSAVAGVTAAVVGMLRLVVSLFGLLLESIVLGGEYLATKPREGESRFSGKRILVATLPVVLVLVMLATLWGLFRGPWQGRARDPGPQPLAAPAAPREEVDRVPGFRAQLEQTIRDRARRAVTERISKRNSPKPQSE